MLEPIKITQKTGNEPLTFNGKDIGFKLIDFWSWGHSDILGNTARGRFAEFIVATALKIDLSIMNDGWNAFDLTSPEGIKVEIKASAYIQTWMQKDFSKINFSIKAARSWNSITNEMAETPSRASDVYVFCLLNHKEQNTIDPMNLDQWEFFVLSILEVNNCNVSTISLKSLQKLTKSVSYSNLREEIIRKHKNELIEKIKKEQ